MLMFPVTIRKSRSLVVVLQAGLEDNFAEVQVSVVDCPDLTQEPFKFPAKGKSPLVQLTLSLLILNISHSRLHTES